MLALSPLLMLPTAILRCLHGTRMVSIPEKHPVLQAESLHASRMLVGMTGLACGILHVAILSMVHGSLHELAD